MRIKKLSALIMAGMITCTAPVMVQAQEENNKIVDFAVETIKNKVIDELVSDPDKVADVIIYAKEAIGSQNVTDEQIYEVIHKAEEHFDIEIEDSEEEIIAELFKEFQDMDIDEEELRKSINEVYDKLESLGLTEDDMKGLLNKAYDFVKNIL